MSNDLLWLLLSYVYVALVIALGTLARAGHRSPDVTRKIIHVGVGSWIIPTTLVFQSPWMAMVPPASFIVLNLLSYRFRVIRAMEEGERNPGTIYFPISFVLCILLFWPGALFPGGLQGVGEPPPAAAEAFRGRVVTAVSIMAMAWGDAAASILGRRFGRHRYRLFGATRSWEGTAAFLVLAALGFSVAFLALAGDRPLQPAVMLALAVPGAVAEALSPKGLDNLTVPLVTGLATAFLLGPWL